MTQTINIAILDAGSTRVIFTTAEHNPADDMDISVDARLEELNLNPSECVWMVVNDDTEIEADHKLNVRYYNSIN